MITLRKTERQKLTYGTFTGFFDAIRWVPHDFGLRSVTPYFKKEADIDCSERLFST